MSVTFKKDTWKIKDPNTGVYRDSSVFATTFAEDTADIVAETTAAIDAQETRAAGIVSGAQADIDTIAAAVQSMTQTGTDTTLTVSGAAADAAAVGELNTAITQEFAWIQGTISASTGGADGVTSTSSTKFTRIRTAGYHTPLAVRGNNKGESSWKLLHPLKPANYTKNLDISTIAQSVTVHLDLKKRKWGVSCRGGHEEQCYMKCASLFVDFADKKSTGRMFNNGNNNIEQYSRVIPRNTEVW